MTHQHLQIPASRHKPPLSTHRRHRYRASALALTLVLTAGACAEDGDDASEATAAPPAGSADTEGSDPTEPANTPPASIEPASTPPANTEPASTEPASTEPTGSVVDPASPGDAATADLSEFCSTVIAADAVASAGPQVDFANAAEDEIRAATEAFAEALVPLLDQLAVGSPDEVADDVATIDDAVRASFESGDDPFADPEVLAADRTIDRFMAENCGYEMISVRAIEYAFEDVPDTLPAETVGFDFDNQGAEVHEMIVMRINDDVDATVEELLAMPEEEAMSMTRFVGAAFAAPGETDITFIDLVPGRYVMLCFIPVGTVSMADGPPPEGPPHLAHGMVHAFTV